MKKCFLSFIVGALLFTSIPVRATIQEYVCYKVDYKIMIGGIEYTNPDLPILNYKGHTYAPLRSVLETAGLNVNWNTELSQAEVTLPDLKVTDEAIKEESPERDNVKGLVFSNPERPLSLVIDVPDGLYNYSIKNGECYLPISVFHYYLTKENDKYIIKIQGKPELVLTQNTVRISDLGMTLRNHDGRLWLENI